MKESTGRKWRFDIPPPETDAPKDKKEMEKDQQKLLATYVKKKLPTYKEIMRTTFQTLRWMGDALGYYLSS